MGDDKAPATQESTAQVLGAFTKYLPALMQVINAQVGPTAQAQLASDKAVSKEQNQLMTDLFREFAPQLAKVGSDIDTSNRTATADTDVAILGNQGAKLAETFKKIDQSLNPEYYATREAGAKSISDLLDSARLDRPDIAAERLVNQESLRSGNAYTPSATSTVGNALQFGNQKAQRENQLSNAISVATSFLQPSTNSQFNPATAALGKPTSNTGLSNFSGIAQNTGANAYSTGNNFLNNVSSLRHQENDINANRRDVLDRFNQTFSSVVGSL